MPESLHLRMHSISYTSNWSVRRIFHSYRLLLGCFILIFFWPSYAEDKLSDRTLVQALLDGGSVLLLRHALAPGISDPDDFRLGDCSTQRNLNETGRQQARAIGDWLRSRGITRAEIYSSQWCRCLETAELLGLGTVTPLPALNSFYARPQDRAPNLAALRDFLAGQKTDGKLIVMVTHQVTISGLTGKFTDSGEGIVLKLVSTSKPALLGRLAFD